MKNLTFIFKMKSGKRKKRSQDTPFNEIISQIKDINAKFLPCLIDYEGYSIYHCDFEKKKENANSPLILSNIFQRWKYYVNEKAKKRFFDMSNIYRYDLLAVSKYFYTWKFKFMQLKNANLILYFRKWQISCDKKFSQHYCLKIFGRAFFQAWKLYYQENKLVDSLETLRMKRCIIIIKKLAYGISVQTPEFLKMYHLYTSIPNKKRYFKRWLRQTQISIRNHKKEQFVQEFPKAYLRLLFTRWEKQCNFRKYLKKKRIKELAIYYEKWRKAPQKMQKYLSKYQQIIKNKNHVVLKKAIKRIKLRYRERKNKRRDVAIKLWTLIVFHELSFYQIHVRRKVKIVAKYFAMMKRRTMRRIRSIKRKAFNQWRRIVFIENAERQIQENYCRIQVETCFIKWRMRLYNIFDDRLIAVVQKDVVERNLIRHYYREWIFRLIEVHREKKRKVKKFRKDMLVVYPFIAWKNFSQIQSIRAQQYLRLKLLRKYFPAFKTYRKDVLKWKYDQVISHSKRLIKKIFFLKLRKAFQEHIQDNDDDDMLIMLFNRKPNFLGVSSINYI